MPVLAFLDALCAALLSRNEPVIRELLSHPLAATLPGAVMVEAYQVLDGGARPYAAPLQTLRLYHQTAHLLGVSSDPSTGRRVVQVAAKSERPQMELPLAVKVA
ncbi:MAG: hypothetical protein ACT4OZ_06785 [Gemmatimonadota bacterium]